MTFNDEFLYVSFVCYDDDSPDVVSTLRRDFNYPLNDNVSFIFESAWVRTPRQFYTGTFAYAGQLVWEDPIPKAGTNISLIPYVSGGGFQDREIDPIASSTELQAGFDAKVSVTPSMNLDLTLNPDFSQTEVDENRVNGRSTTEKYLRKRLGVVGIS